jgi:hypothetical protein
MEHRLPIPSIFSTDEKEWTETLNGLLAEDAQRIVWLSLESRPLTLCARPYRLRFDERKIYLYEPQQSPNPNQPHLAIVALPEPDIGYCYRCSTENGGTRLWLKFRLLRDGDPQNDYEMFAQVVIATSKELVTAEPSAIPRHSVQ